MTDKIRTILEDLYAIDPAFRDKEQELITIINKLLELRPDTRFDQAFAARLRQQLAAYESASPERNNHMTFIERIFSKTPFVLAGAALLVLLGIFVFQDGVFQNTRQNNTKVVSYTAAGENAFGSLLTLSNSPAPNQSAEMATGKDIAVGRGGGTAMAMLADSKASPLIYPGPDMVNYRFVYNGGEFPLPGSEVDVYRKLKGTLSGGNISGIIGAASGLMDFSTFGSTKLQNVSFYEDYDGGYQIYADLYEGTVQINERFPTIMEPQTFGVPDMPDKAQMIAVANQFLADHRVNMEGYGEPEIQEWWYQTMTMGMPVQEDIRAADVSVVYPLLIKGTKALDQSGSPTGLVVNVRISDMKATGLWNLSARSFETSAYAAETDRDKILALAERGGINNYYYPAVEGEGMVKTIDVEIGTPAYAYIQYWKYDGMQGSEIYVPAYIFPITSQADVQIWQKYVVVPIVTELIDSAPPYPVPMMMEGSSGVAR